MQRSFILASLFNVSKETTTSNNQIWRTWAHDTTSFLFPIHASQMLRHMVFIYSPSDLKHLFGNKYWKFMLQSDALVTVAVARRELSMGERERIHEFVCLAMVRMRSCAWHVTQAGNSSAAPWKNEILRKVVFMRFTKVSFLLPTSRQVCHPYTALLRC